jgi:hypothetical protein
VNTKGVKKERLSVFTNRWGNLPSGHPFPLPFRRLPPLLTVSFCTPLRWVNGDRFALQAALMLNRSIHAVSPGRRRKLRFPCGVGGALIGTSRIMTIPGTDAGQDRCGTDRCGTGRCGTDRCGTDRCGTIDAGIDAGSMRDRRNNPRPMRTDAGRDRCGTDEITPGTDAGRPMRDRRNNPRIELEQRRQWRVEGWDCFRYAAKCGDDGSKRIEGEGSLSLTGLRSFFRPRLLPSQRAMHLLFQSARELY